MNDAEFKAWCDKIDERIAFWYSRMHLSQWSWSITYHRTQQTDPEGMHEGAACPFQVRVMWEYMRWDLEAFIDALHSIDPTDAELDRLLIHEMAHAHTAELRRFTREKRLADHLESEERVVTTFEKIIGGLYEELAAWDQKQERKIKRLEQQVARLKQAKEAA